MGTYIERLRQIELKERQKIRSGKAQTIRPGEDVFPVVFDLSHGSNIHSYLTQPQLLRLREVLARRPPRKEGQVDIELSLGLPSSLPQQQPVASPKPQVEVSPIDPEVRQRFGTFYSETYEKSVAFVRKQLGYGFSDSEIEIIVNDVYSNILQKYHDNKTEDWYHVISRCLINASKNFFRSRNRYPEISLNTTAEGGCHARSLSTGGRLEKSSASMDIEEAVSYIVPALQGVTTDLDRLVFILKLNGLWDEEIAHILGEGVNFNAVKSRMNRIRFRSKKEASRLCRNVYMSKVA
jgi:DNA-directed RNA polymerase specialized sigma24 family protein